MRRLYILLLTLGVLSSGGWFSSSHTAVAMGCPQTIGMGDPVDCDISAADEIDSYTFTATAGDVLHSVTVRTTGALNPAVEITDGSGNTVEGCTRIGSPAEFQCTLPQNGTYNFRIRDSSNTNTGSYRIFLQRMNNPGNATAMSYGTVLNGNVDVVGVSDAFSFTADGDDVLRARVLRSTGTMRPIVEVWNTNGQLVCSAEGSVSGFAYTDTCTLPGAGQYFLFVSDEETENTGSFRLFLERFNAPVGAMDIEIGTPLTENIEEKAEFDFYTFAADAGDIFKVRLVRLTGLIETFIGIYDAEGQLVCSDNGSEGFAEILNCGIPETGEYSLLVRANMLPGETGRYRLAMQRLNNPANTQPILFGQTVTDAIEVGGELDVYTFTALSNRTVGLHLTRTAGTLRPYLAIRDAEGQIVCYDSGTSGELEIEACPLTDAGTYSIYVDADDVPESTGDYTLTLLCGEANCGPTILKTYLPIAQR